MLENDNIWFLNLLSKTHDKDYKPTIKLAKKFERPNFQNQKNGNGTLFQIHL